MSRIAAWSQTLRERREAASLSHHKLAELSGVPEGALQALEGGTYAPSQMALLHLLSVPELDLETHSLPWEASASDPNLALNCWLAPGFDPVKMIKDLALQVNGHGGHIEQSFLYMDHVLSLIHISAWETTWPPTTTAGFKIKRWHRPNSKLKIAAPAAPIRICLLYTSGRGQLLATTAPEATVVETPGAAAVAFPPLSIRRS